MLDATFVQLAIVMGPVMHYLERGGMTKIMMF